MTSSLSLSLSLSLSRACVCVYACRALNSLQSYVHSLKADMSKLHAQVDRYSSSMSESYKSSRCVCDVHYLESQRSLQLLIFQVDREPN